MRRILIVYMLFSIALMQSTSCWANIAPLSLDSIELLRNRRQNELWLPADNNSGSSTTAAPSVDINSNAYKMCIQNCGTTWQYNPVCGSDNVNYHNEFRLQCAQRCGLDVVSLRSGVCSG